MPRSPATSIHEPLDASLRRGTPHVWVTPANSGGERRALLGWGERHRMEAFGPGRFRELAAAFEEYAGSDPGAHAFVTVTFAAESEVASVLIVPESLGRWESGILHVQGMVPEPAPERPLEELDILPGRLTREGFRHAVAEALHRIAQGEAEKVVVARDLLAVGPHPIDLPAVLVRLVHANPGAMIFHVDGMFGASPELLIRRDGDRLTSRVLAGSIPATGEGAVDAAAAASLAASAKDAAEHEYAVRSVADRLATVAEVRVAETTVLSLTTIQHLATDISGVLREALSAIALAELVHPSAAVCGTPTDVAGRIIAELEGFDRGRYAGPVGWLNADGDGEFAIALRCGQLSDDGASVRLYAGGGVVAGSVPSDELAESAQKFLPVYHALSPVARP
ncbi:MAG TPA: isochorismate synthase [Actinomycetaceae bacterium]|nr:isochorismate synthase [Actinomycetaceae bacterium]